MTLEEFYITREARRRHAIDQALWFLWNRGASRDHPGEGEEAEQLKTIHDTTGLSPEQLDRVKALLPLVMRSELEKNL